MTVNMAEEAAPPLFHWICCSLNRWFLLINLELLNREISQWEAKRHKVLMAWWPRWQLVKEKDRRLISQYVILLHHCLYTMLSHLFFTPPPPIPFLSLLLSLLAASPPFLSSVSLPPLYLFTLVLLQFLSYEPHIAPFLTIRPLQPNALFSLNALFLLTSCLHPSQWPCITPGRIITLGWNISSVAPYSALSALSIYGVSPFVVSHLPTVQ